MNSINGEREASGTLFTDFATEQIPLALATIEKTAANVDPGATPAANDNIITYNLDLSVASGSPDGRFVAEDLVGTPITLEGVAGTRILVSDVIPVGTELNCPTHGVAG